MTAKATFQVYTDVAGEWRWRLVHDNGNIIAEGGQGYTTKRRALDGIKSVEENAPGAGIEGKRAQSGSKESAATFEVYRDAAEEWRWRLVHDNGNLIAEGGQGYASNRGAIDGIASVKANVSGAAIEEHRIRELGDP